MKNASRSGEERVNAVPPDGRVIYRPAWLEQQEAAMLFAVLRDRIPWQRRELRMFGRTIEQPRRIAFQGDAGVVYRYSGDDYRADPWHPLIERLRDRLADEDGLAFNSVLLNLYRDGRDGMGWHSDDEPELGRNPTIASLSLGQSRRFLLRSRQDRTRKLELLPESGSLVVMDGDLQHHWQHQLPKTARPMGARINLTFRRIVR